MKETVYKKRVLELTASDIMTVLIEHYGLEQRNLLVVVSEDYDYTCSQINPNNMDTWLTIISEEGTL